MYVFACKLCTRVLVASVRLHVRVRACVRSCVPELKHASFSADSPEVVTFVTHSAQTVAGVKCTANLVIVLLQFEW